MSLNIEIDRANAEFWNELCGSGFARHLGITDHSFESLKKFDDAYLDFYPYLLEHVPVSTFSGKKILEIGLGYGTLGQKIAESGAEYTGLDIAQGPVNMMNHRLRLLQLSGKAVQGSMLECPLKSVTQDCVVSIGCFHHTGNVQRCFDETWRVLKPGGNAYLMVYNQFSYRQWLKWPEETLRAFRAEAAGLNDAATNETQIKAYDTNISGQAAPETVFLSVRQLRRMLGKFNMVKLGKENCDDLSFRGHMLIPRRKLLSTFGKTMGLDIYIQARK